VINPELAWVLLLTVGAGLGMPLGGWLARIEHVQSRWLETELRHFVLALGAGILLGAVTLILVPEGMARMPSVTASVVAMVVGGGLCFAFERFVSAKRQSAPQAMGMLLDYIPESVALGGLALSDRRTALVLAVLMGVQNIPEGFNAYREMRQTGGPRVLRTMLVMALMGGVAGAAGYFWLAGQARLLAAIMLAAGGAILYLIFQDIAPQIPLKKSWAPPLGAVIGFSLTMLSTQFAGA